MTKRPRFVALAPGVGIWLADCRQVFREIEAGVHVITDAPYEQHMHEAKRKKTYGAQRRIRTDGHANPPPVDFSSIDGLREVVVEPLVKLCGGWFIAFCTPEGIAPWRDALEAAGARYKRACFWTKTELGTAIQWSGAGLRRRTVRHRLVREGRLALERRRPAELVDIPDEWYRSGRHASDRKAARAHG